MKKINIEVIIEQLEEMESAFHDLNDSCYQIRKALKDELKENQT